MYDGDFVMTIKDTPERKAVRDATRARHKRAELMGLVELYMRRSIHALDDERAQRQLAQYIDKGEWKDGGKMEEDNFDPFN